MRLQARVVKRALSPRFISISPCSAGLQACLVSATLKGPRGLRYVSATGSRALTASEKRLLRLTRQPEIPVAGQLLAVDIQSDHGNIGRRVSR
jgi:hypothetical protein